MTQPILNSIVKTSPKATSVVSTKTDFFNKFLGTFDNRHQAYSNPTGFAFIHISNTMLEDGTIHQKAWYHYEDESRPYRQTILTVDYTSDKEVRLRNQSAGCVLKFIKEGKQWLGKFDGKCEREGATIDTYIRLTGPEYQCYDVAYNPTGAKLWGGTDIYVFTRTGE